VSLKNDNERNNTQIKLARLAKRHQALSSETGGDVDLREITIESLKRTMNQLQEEISLYDAHRKMAGQETHT
jgi:hypothetical protein